MAEPATREELLASLRQSLAVIEKLEGELARTRESIAVVGLSCRFPGADDPEAFWELLRDGVDAVTEVPAERWDAEAFYDPDPETPGKTYSRQGGFLSRVDGFDPLFFGISPKEAARIDPQHRLLLEVAWEALEVAGIAPRSLRNSRTGIYVGIGENDYARLIEQAAAANGYDHYDATGTGYCFASGRLSHALGLQGPNLAIDTGCSSSLVAIHQAVTSLRLGECDLALAGGVQMRLTVGSTLALSKTRALAPDGRCKAFDASGDGFSRGEGCGLVVLKRLSEARRDRDRVLAVIRGSAVNHDGPASGLTVPNEKAQVDLVRAALANAGVEPREVGFVEAHGTGTKLGDPIEVGALATVFGDRREPLLLGSVKSNIGHAEGAAGIAGVIKAVLALEHGVVPPNVHFESPNPYIPWDELPFTVPVRPSEWPLGEAPRIAGVSSFSMNGTNAHVVLAEAPPSELETAEVKALDDDRPLHLLALSAKSPAALAALAARYSDHLANEQAAGREVRIGDLCFTANTGRSHFDHRLAILAGSTAELGETLASWGAGGTPATAVPAKHEVRSTRGAPRIAFLFTGQGSQYPGMARALYAAQPTFRRALDRCAAVLDPLLGKPLVDLLTDDSGALDQTALTQPALFAVEVALAELWRSWGIEPALVMGHSVGELAAACVAGVFTLEDGLALVAERGRLMQALPAGGAMVSVRAELERVAEALAGRDRVALAAINGPREVVISGDGGEVAAAVAELEEAGLECKRLAVSHAFHSPLMEPMLDAFAGAAGAVTYATPRIPVVSNLTGSIVGAEISSPGHWVRHAHRPVRFSDGLSRLAEEGVDVYLEIGPKPVLLGLGRRAADGGASRSEDEPLWLPSLRPDREWQQLLSSLAQLYVRGAPVDWTGVERDHAPSRRKLVLPTYPFQRQRYWVESAGVDAPPAAGAAIGWRVAPLLDRRVHSSLHRATIFETDLGLAGLPFLADHRIAGALLSPAACHLSMLASAAATVLDVSSLALEDLVFPRPLAVPDEGSTAVQVVLEEAPADGAQGREVRLLGAPAAAGGRAVTYAQGRVAIDGLPTGTTLGTASRPLDELCADLPSEVSGEALYEHLASLGVELGPAFRWIDRLWHGDDEVLLELRPPAVVDEARLPGLLDACLQVTVVPSLGAPGAETVELRLPFALRRLRLELGAEERACWIHARRAAAPADGAGEWDAAILDADGRVVAEMIGFEERAVGDDFDASVAAHEPVWHRWLAQPVWRPADALSRALVAETAAAKGRWLVVDGEDGGSDEDVAARVAGVLGGRLVPAASCADLIARELESAAAAADPLAGVVLAVGRPTPAGEALGFAAAPAPDEQDPSTRAEVLSAALLRLTQTLSRVETPAGRPPPRLVLVTAGAWALAGGEVPDPGQSAPWGLARTIVAEHPELACTCIDLDPGADADLAASTSALPALLAALTALPVGASAAVGRRVALRGGALYAEELARWRPPRKGEPERWVLDEYGSPDDLRLAPYERRPPDDGEVEIEVRAAGLNFRDVLVALGMLREHYERDLDLHRARDIPLGFECAGVVSAVGAGVSGLAVGDRVFAMTDGAFASHVTATVGEVARLPVGMSFADGATVPLAFLTAHHALVRLARLAPGERVLIHAAAGGVGMAAVQIAQAIGAEVFATASEGKWEVLRSLGVAHVTSSRETGFAEPIRAATGGRGVDVVLNSLSGELLAESVAVLAEGGRFVEIGRLGIWEPERMSAERPDVGYYPFDLGDEAEADPTLLPSLFAELTSGFETGDLEPLPRKVFPFSRAREAYRFMQAARHVGKLVLAVDPPVVEPRSDASYLITGGLGGLGLAVGRRLASLGAGHLVLAGRRAELSDEARAAIAEMESSGAAVRVERTDVADPAAVERLLAACAEAAPLAGVVHAAGVLDDGVLDLQTPERLRRVLDPKARGAWLLHRGTLGTPLDFFVAFSSVASLAEAGGQGPYAAANAFLDGLMHRRRAVGLPGLAINWGSWAEVGMAARMDPMLARGEATVPPDAGLDALVALLGAGIAQVAVAPAGLPGLPVTDGTAPPGSPASAAGSSPRPTDGASESPARRLASAPAAERPTLLTAYVHERVAEIFGLVASDAFDDRTPFSELGADSLMVVELRNRLQRDLELTLSSTVAFDHPTIERLAVHLAAKLGFEPTADEGAPATEVPPELAPEIAEDELRTMLDEELQLLASEDDGGRGS